MTTTLTPASTRTATATPDEAPTTAPATVPATAPTTDGLWITRLFADSTQAAAPTAVLTSPSAAYQDAIYDRGVLVDLRTVFTLPHLGALASDLGVVVIDPSSPSGYADLVNLATTTALVLVTSDGSHALRLSEHLHSLGLPEVSALRGGFGAWLAYGLPTARSGA